MTDCQTIQPLLSEFQDDHLDARTAWDVQTHVAGCAACAQTQRELFKLRDALHALPAPTLSAGFEAALAERLAFTRRPVTSSGTASWKNRMATLFANPPVWRLRPMLAFGAAGAAAALGLFFLPAPAPPALPPNAAQAAPVDRAFVAECVAQRRREAAGEPLADLSAQNLAGHLDTAPTDNTPADSAPTDAGMF